MSSQSLSQSLKTIVQLVEPIMFMVKTIMTKGHLQK